MSPFAENHVSSLALDRYLARELDGPACTTLEEHCERCADCKRALERREASYREFLNAHPEPPSALRECRARRRGVPWMRKLVPGFGLVTAAMCILFMLRPPEQNVLDLSGIDAPTSLAPETLRTKGRPRFAVEVIRGAEAFMVDETRALMAGDRIQFYVSQPESVYIAVLALENDGALMPLLPTEGALPRVSAGQHIKLPFAVEVDAIGISEVFVALFCDTSRDISHVLAAGDPQSLVQHPPAGCTVDLLRLSKRGAGH